MVLSAFVGKTKLVGNWYARLSVCRAAMVRSVWPLVGALGENRLTIAWFPIV